MKRFKKILCTLLVIVLCLTSAPLQGFVGMKWPELSDINFGEWFTSNANALETSGSCGESVNYTYNRLTKKLVISGSGNMTDYFFETSPFEDSDIQTVILEEGVTSIGANAFRICSDLIDVMIPTSVTTINEAAFWGCDNLMSISIPKGVLTIGYKAFGACYNLSKITIAEGISVIGESAFEYCTSLIDINLPNSIVSIENGAFDHCESLTSVIIPQNVTNIGNSVFNSCHSLEFVSIPESVISIGNAAFEWCISLQNITIPNSVTYIGDGAFQCCLNLISITIPDNVNSIGNYAFNSCDNLSHIMVDRDNAYYSSDSGVLFNKDKTELICFPVNNIRTDYTVPNSVKTILAYAFQGNKNLINLTVGDRVVNIGDFAFYCCSSLASIIIGNNVSSIGTNAFAGSEKLTNITLGKNISSIGEGAFSYCKSLTSITVDENNDIYSCDDYGVLFNKNKSELICFPISNVQKTYKIPKSVTTIKYLAFNSCEQLFSVVIPNSLKTIEVFAFYDCNNLNDIYYEGSEYEWNNISIGEVNDSLLESTIHYNYLYDTPQFPEQNAKFTIHTFASQPKLIMGYGDAMTMKFELECHNVDTGENFLVSNPTFALSSSDTDVFTVENIEKDGQTTSARLVSENPGNAILTVGAYANGKLVESLQYLIAVEGECVYHIDTLINGKGDKNYNLYSYSNGIHVDNLGYVETGEECNLSFDAYNSVNCIAAIEVYSADGELLATKSISAFGGTLPTGIWDTFKQMYEFANKDFSNISYKDKEYSKKTEVTLLGVPTDGHIKITTDVEDSWACAFYNISDLLVDSSLKIIDLVFETEDARNKATEKLTDQILGKVLSDDNLKKVFEEIIRKYFQSIKIGSKEEIRDSLEEYVLGIEELDINIGEIILDVLKGMGISVAETVISFLLGPVKGFVETIFAVVSFSKLIDHGVTVEELRGSRGSEIYFKRYASAIRYSNGYHINNSEPFPDDVSFHTYKILSGDTYNIATSNFSDATYIDVISMALYKDGKETQPNGKIQVAIPIPEGMNIFSFKVYRQEADGSFEQLDCDFSNVNDGYIYITTDHFSVYCIVGDIIEPESIYFENDEYSVEVGKGLIPQPKFSPENAYAVNYFVTSSNENIAKVSDSGMIVGKAKGKAVITVIAKNGISSTFVVNVVPEPCIDHIYGDKDANCKNCGFDRTEDCSCNCHKSGIANFFFKIILFFQKLFKSNQICKCGVKHY